MQKELSSEIIDFYQSLTVEKKDFNLPLREIPQAKLLVWERNNTTILGLAGLSKDNSLFLIVKKEYQNQKIGQKLTKKVIDQAKKLNYHYIKLNVFKSNMKAIHIYTKFGFTILFSNMIRFRENFFMVLPLDFKGSLFVISFRIRHRLPLYGTRQLVNKVKAVLNLIQVRART